MRLGSKNGHGSGMIKFSERVLLPSERSANVTDRPVTGSKAVKGGALLALSDQI
jgi:hypothetical protein